MTYGRTPLQETLLTGRRLLSRHYYGDGRWGWRQRTALEEREYGAWRVVKMRPKAVTWAKPTGSRLARKTHAIRYSLTATHKAGHVVYLTVWWCGGMAHSAPSPESHPVVVCAGCHARLAGVREIAIEGAA